MAEKKKSQLIQIVFLVVVLLGISYVLLTQILDMDISFGGSATDSTTTSNFTPVKDTFDLETDLLTGPRIRSFREPVYKSYDEVEVGEVGRPNPFLPIVSEESAEN